MKIKRIYYTSKFAKNFQSLPAKIQKKAVKKEKIFRENPFHPTLKSHKLKGSLRNFYSFSVDYRYRIVFIFEDPDTVTFIDIGDHSIYK